MLVVSFASLELLEVVDDDELDTVDANEASEFERQAIELRLLDARDENRKLVKFRGDVLNAINLGIDDASHEHARERDLGRARKYFLHDVGVAHLDRDDSDLVTGAGSVDGDRGCHRRLSDAGTSTEHIHLPALEAVGDVV